ncbi:hypothetical protein BRC90_11885 [Halobacteriales archaeon QS_4_69_34]|nr:MAG: hypothetical protein BRC90_11885 [Halobacteriales archaeon QS_4_69_34]
MFVAWREPFYDRRAEFLYRSVKGDDHVLVSTRGEHADTAAAFAARLASAHRAGKVVLLEIADEAALDDAGRESGSDRGDRTRVVSADGGGGVESGGVEGEGLAEHGIDGRTADRLASVECHVEAETGVPCETLVAAERGSAAKTVLRATRESDRDLVVTPYEAEPEGSRRTSPGCSAGTSTPWPSARRADGSGGVESPVPVRRAGGIAHSMLGLARRLAGDDG